MIYPCQEYLNLATSVTDLEAFYGKFVVTGE